MEAAIQKDEAGGVRKDQRHSCLRDQRCPLPYLGMGKGGKTKPQRARHKAGHREHNTQPLRSRRGVRHAQTNRALGSVRNRTNKTYSPRGERPRPTTQKCHGQGVGAELARGTTSRFSCTRTERVEGVPSHSCMSFGDLGLELKSDGQGKKFEPVLAPQEGIWPLGDRRRMRWIIILSPCQLRFIRGLAWWERLGPACLSSCWQQFSLGI